MQANLRFLAQLLRHRKRLVIGYEIVKRTPDGRRSVCRYLRVGTGTEMEVDLGRGMLLKQRNDRPTMYRKMREEEL